MNPKYLLTAVTALFLTPFGYADLITGTVVDANGVPVAGVNIVAQSLTGGGNGNIANAGTDAFGIFNSTIDPGTYQLTFEPPAPPASVALSTVVDNVVVLGITPLGTVVLDAAVSLQGRVLQQNGLPAAGVNLDIIEKATGINIDLIGDTTNALGMFQMAVPPGELELRLKPSQVNPPLLAPLKLDVSAPVSLNIGDLVVKPGFLVSGAVLDPNFQPVRNLDFDAIDTLSGDKLYTPGDNTDNNGFVDFVVPAGIYDLELCPQLNDGLVALRMSAVPVNASTNLGIISLVAGVHLTGNITSFAGTPVFNADLDLRDTTTLMDILLCGDNANAAGDYDIVVPTGIFDITFTPPDAEKLGSSFANTVVINGNTQLNAVLPFCDCGAVSGNGIAGSGGITPTIAPTGGGLRLGSHGWGFDVGQALGGTYGIAGIGFSAGCGGGLSATLTTLGGHTLVSGRVHAVPFRVDGAPGVAGTGSAHVSFAIPHDFALVGATLSAHAQITDPGGPGGRSMTPLLCGILCQ